MAVVEELAGFDEASPGVRVGGQPSRRALEEAAQAGVQVVVDLRAADEERGFDERQVVEGLGMAYTPIPISGAADLDGARARRLNEALARGPALVHCGSGDRVGGLFAVRARFVQGLEPADAMEVGRRHGLTGLAPEVEAKVRLD